MTKKELLESELFKMTPDDAEIVFRTNKRMNLCCKLKLEHLSLRKQCINVEEVQEGPFYKFRNPQYIVALVIDGMPFDFMDSMFNIHFEITRD